MVQEEKIKKKNSHTEYLSLQLGVWKSHVL